MSSNDSNDHIAANTTFDFKGKTWLMSPLVMSDFKEMEDDFKREQLRLIKSELGGLEPEDRQFLLGKAYDDIKGIRLGSPEFDVRAATMNGTALMLYLSLRKRQESVTKAEAFDMLTANNIGELTEKILEMAGFKNDPLIVPPEAKAKQE